MRIANTGSTTLVVTTEGKGWDVAAESGGRFGPSTGDVLRDWAAFTAWASSHEPATVLDVDERALQCVSPDARQVFAVGLNYDEHSVETGLAVGDFPPVFPKWSSSLAGASGSVAVPAEDSHVDWEVELVAVIGARASHVAVEDALDHVAGYAVGQDFSDRAVQFAGASPQQFGLGKSFPGFSPVGPHLVTPDEVGALADLRITCSVDGEVKQDGTLGQMIFPVPQIISILSGIVTLEPGDLVFTGTPSGVGFAREPQEFLRPGSRVETTIERVGTMTHDVVAR